jgi:PKHD-type hydroxylase
MPITRGSHATGYVITQSPFNEKELDAIVDIGLKAGMSRGDIVPPSGIYAEGQKQEPIRKSNISWLEKNYLTHINAPWVWAKLFPFIDDVNEKHFGFDLVDVEPLQFTEYQGNENGYYKQHHDCDFVEFGWMRKLSFTLQLSDPQQYEGGDLVMGRDMNVSGKEPQQKQRGMITFFPSYMLHGVLPVTSGVRHSLVGWAKGATFR